jgi:hypothetical protein
MAFFFSTPKLTDVLPEVRRLLKESQFKAAATLLTKARKKNLFAAELSLLWSQVHAGMGDRSAQHAALKQFMAERPNDVLHHLKVIQFLMQEEEYETAQLFLNEIKRRFPLSGFTHHSQALLHCKHQEYELAAGALLQKQEVKVLDDSDIALIRLIRKGVAGKFETNALQLLSHPHVRQILLRYSYERFESLGGDCEFGFHQRRHGREPLSLFRWAGMPREKMIALFNKQLQDFASEDAAALQPNAPDLEDGDSLEYYFHDRQYDFYSHTNATKKSVDFSQTEADILQSIRPHFLMLSRKLREDLAAAEKAFIYKSKLNISNAQCVELHDAMCTLGNNKLLIIQLKQGAPSEQSDQADQADQASQANLEIIRPNLLVGRVSAWWGGGASEYTHPVTKEWDTLIEQAYLHFVTHYPEMEMA